MQGSLPDEDRYTEDDRGDKEVACLKIEDVEQLDVVLFRD